MKKVRKILERLSRVVRSILRQLFLRTTQIIILLLLGFSIALRALRKTWLGEKITAAYRNRHQKYVQRPHSHLMNRSSAYAKWHNWNYKGVHHGHVHGGVAAAHLVLVGVIIFNLVSQVFAADLTDTWNFSTPASFNMSNGIETSGSSARLKSQEYSADPNTNALYHLNEASGTAADDATTNNNDLTLHNGASFDQGRLNNALKLDGNNQYASAPDSPSLSVTGQQSVEAWIKPDQTFNSSSNQDMTVADKGSYRMGLNSANGKAFYEIQNSSNSDQWSHKLGGMNNAGWSANHSTILSSIGYGTDLYVGTGGVAGDGEVWKWNGSTWTMIGGDGIRSGWADNTYEGVYSLATNGTALYAGLGASNGDGEVWTCELNTNCATWTKIGGDNIGVITAATQYIASMIVYKGSLYVGAGATNTGYADVYRYDGGTSWVQVGGDAINSSWAISTFEAVTSMYADATYLYAGIGTTAGDGEVWRYDGTAWEMIGGDGINSSWNLSHNSVRSMTILNGVLYAGLGDVSNRASVYYWNGAVWADTNIGLSGAITQVQSLATDGTYVYAARNGGTGPISRWNGSAWTQIGGNSIDSSWAAAVAVPTLTWLNGKLYTGISSTSDGLGGAVWEWNGSTWGIIGGQYLNNSWGGNGTASVNSSQTWNDKLYFGLGASTGYGAQVWEYDGNNAHIVGGNGINGSWAGGSHTSVSSLASYNGKLYAALRSPNLGLGQVWEYNGTSWTQVGGQQVNGSWGATAIHSIESMAVWNNRLYIIQGNQNFTHQVWGYDGASWTRIDPGWPSSVRMGQSLTAYNGQLCASIGGPGARSRVDCYNGSTWTMIGGDGINGSWAETDNGYVNLSVYKERLIASHASATSNLTVWQWNGSTWTMIGGDGINGSWAAGTIANGTTAFSVYSGDLYMSTNSSPRSDIWRYDGASWQRTGGDGINGSWAAAQTIEVALSLTTYKGKLYAGLGHTGNADALVYSFGNNGYIESSSSSFSADWTHLAGTYDGVTMKLFVNGQEETSQPVAVASVDSDTELYVGSSFGSNTAGKGSQHFKGQIDELRISNTARTTFNSKPYASSAQTATLGAAVRRSGIAGWDGFTTAETTNGGTITYRLSDDEGQNWKYWDGNSWSISSELNQANTALVVNDHIADFPITFGGILWQAILTGNGNQRVQLDSVTLTANSDDDNPVNVSNIQAYRSNGGDEIASNDWTNAASPYFDWSAGSDAGSGVLGYCLYLGTSSSADPVITKGLLGSSPVSAGGNCQFVVGGTELDLSTGGYLSSALATSNDPYYLNIKTIDRAGNISSGMEQFQFRFDNTPPANPGFITAPSQFVSNKEVTFTWPTSGPEAPNDPNSGLQGLQYRIGQNGSWYGSGANGEGLLTNNGNYTTRNNPDFANIQEGNNTIFFRTWDQAGNVTTTYVTAALRLNTVSPGSPQNISATPTTNSTNSFSFSWQPPTSFSGTASTLTYCYTINTAPNANTCTFTAPGVVTLPAGAYATQPGDNTFYVAAKDEAGNINYATNASVIFTANTAAPGIPMDIDVADVSVKATSSWKLALTWESPTSVGAGVANYRIERSVDGSNFVQVASTAGTSYVDSGLQPVEYYYRVRACDSANNCGAFSATVNDEPTGKFTEPAVITAQPTVSGVSTKKATIRWATDRKSDSKISIGTRPGQYEPFQVASPAQVTDHLVDLANLTPGTNYFAKAVWTDEDGNTGMSNEFTFTTAPAPSTQEVITMRTTLNSAQIRFTSVSAAKVVIQYGKSDNFGGEKEVSTSLSTSTYDVELGGLDDGSKYLYRINTFDAEGNEYIGSTVLSFTTPARPRIQNLQFQPIEGEPTSTQRITWRTNVPSSSLVRFTSTNVPAKEISDSQLTIEHEIVVRDLQDDTEYSFVAESRDAGGNLATSDTQSLKTALDTRPPKISDITVETSIRGMGAEARGQVILSWRTDELSTSQVAYVEGSGAKVFNNKTSEDAALSLEHVVIVSDLPTSRVYSVRPISKDKSGNEGYGETKSAIIGRASDSVMTIVLNTLKKVFGF